MINEIEIALGITFGVLFALVDYYEHRGFKIHPSLIAGFSVSYFFLNVLPEIGENTHHILVDHPDFEYMFVLFGFVVIHVSEKMVLQKVEVNAQKSLRKLVKMEESLDLVQDNIANILHHELDTSKCDDIAIKELSDTLVSLNAQGQELEKQILAAKGKIKNHLHINLAKLRGISKFIYHFLIGLILINLLLINLTSGILFFFFAIFMAFISNQPTNHRIFSDLDIEVEFDDPFSKNTRIILSIASLSGILLGIILIFRFNVSLITIFQLFSFMSGVILYTIVRNVIPEKEIGKPLLFLGGFVAYFIFMVILELIF